MLNAKTIGVLLGLLFGVVLVWQGAGAAGLVLLFAAIGWLVGFLLWLIGRIAGGEVDLAAIRELVALLLGGRTGR